MSVNTHTQLVQHHYHKQLQWNMAESTERQEVSGEQVFMPLGEIREPEMLSENIPPFFPTRSCPRSVLRFLLQSSLILVLSVHSFPSWLLSFLLPSFLISFCVPLSLSPRSSSSCFYISQYRIMSATLLLCRPAPFMHQYLMSSFITCKIQMYRTQHVYMARQMFHLFFYLFTTQCSKYSVHDRPAHHILYNPV